ncbi:MAG: hypothetical protein BWK73_06715 [Thiothrix lacustris]|uniref:Uncharacterized protein n=1 Tax=Thiothrix lacustris TaxID=525917 RepID=A0A1Y1QWN1_9GAMM|nr:MAG: hypothetical protein BWK73_06715 [Thiothrix lacustris]
MHDIDRIRLESQFENEQYMTNSLQSEQFDYGETSYFNGEYESVFNESQEMELASDLLEVMNEAELDRFLSDFIRKASKAVGGFIKSPAGTAIGGLLKNVAKQALPRIGSAVGRHFGGEAGAQLGDQLATNASGLFGLELEGLSDEDREFEVARQFVRFAGDAAKNLALAAPRQNLQNTVRDAVVTAAQQYAPGLLQPKKPSVPMPTPPINPDLGNSGRWLRRGNKIILYGM